MVLGQGVRHGFFLRQATPDPGSHRAAGQGFQEAPPQVIISGSLGDDAVELQVMGHELLDVGVLVYASMVFLRARSSSGVILPAAKCAVAGSRIRRTSKSSRMDRSWCRSTTKATASLSSFASRLVT